MNRSHQNQRQNQRGSVLLLLVITLPLLFALSAIAVDVGALYLQRAHMQNIADAAALAGAAQLAAGDEVAAAAAERYIALNGAPPGQTHTVEIKSAGSAASGAYDTVRVELERPSPLIFARYFNVPALTLAAAAEAQGFAGGISGEYAYIERDASDPLRRFSVFGGGAAYIGRAADDVLVSPILYGGGPLYIDGDIAIDASSRLVILYNGSANFLNFIETENVYINGNITTDYQNTSSVATIVIKHSTISPGVLVSDQLRTYPYTAPAKQRLYLKGDLQLNGQSNSLYYENDPAVYINGDLLLSGRYTTLFGGPGQFYVNGDMTWSGTGAGLGGGVVTSGYPQGLDIIVNGDATFNSVAVPGVISQSELRFGHITVGGEAINVPTSSRFELNRLTKLPAGAPPACGSKSFLQL